MAEAVAAFSIAAGVMQFAQVGSKILKEFWSIYKSGSGTNNLISNAKLLTSDLNGVLDELASVRSRFGPDSAQSFETLLEGCDTTAQELLQMLASITKNASGKDAASALKVTLRSVWKAGDIKQLEQRLDSFRNQIVAHLLSNLCCEVRKPEAHQMSVLSQTRDILLRAESLQKKLDEQQTLKEGLGTGVVNIIAASVEAREATWLKQQLLQNLVTIIQEHHGSASGQSENTPPILSHERYQQLTKTFLAQLWYRSMEEREQTVASAHEQTFKWVFEKPEAHQKWDSLADWLSSPSQLYWITGKAGSGKSTLMKYISTPSPAAESSQISLLASSNCYQFLRCWAPEPLQLLVARFYFWNSGQSIQTTKEGLLRSLLHQILSQDPALIAAAVPKHWDPLCLFNVDVSGLPLWSEQELITMLQSTLKRLSPQTRVCLFVDGLDEFSGDHSIITNLFEEILRNPQVKLCAASRPWDIFEAAFDQRPSLHMEDLTYDDITKYVTARLDESSAFKSLIEREAEYAGKLIEKISKKASGVFLWVFLVVKSLLAGMRHGDRVMDLERRLDALPPHLEELYDKMLDSLDPIYLEHAAQLFAITRTIDQPAHLLVLSFIDDEKYKTVIAKEAIPMSQRETQLRLDAMRLRVNSRTKGLLEVTSTESPQFGSGTVQYLHRTVHDYLETQSVRDRLECAMRSPFDVHLQICVGIVATIKALQCPQITISRTAPQYWVKSDLAAETFVSSELSTYTQQFMHSISRTTLGDGHKIVTLMNEMDKSAAKLSRALTASLGNIQHDATILKPRMPQKLWAIQTGQWPCIFGPNPSFFPNDIRSLAVAYGVIDYVDDITDIITYVDVVENLPSGAIRRQSRSLLLCAIDSFETAEGRIYTEIVERLLQKPINLNLNMMEPDEESEHAVGLVSRISYTWNKRPQRTKMLQYLSIVELFLKYYDTVWRTGGARYIQTSENRAEYLKQLVDLHSGMKDLDNVDKGADESVVQKVTGLLYKHGLSRQQVRWVLKHRRSRVSYVKEKHFRSSCLFLLCYTAISLRDAPLGSSARFINWYHQCVLQSVCDRPLMTEDDFVN